MATPTMEMYGSKKQISLITSANTELYYRLEYIMSGLNTPEIYHLLGQMMRTRVKAAKAQGIERPTSLSDVEFFTLLIAFDSDLLNEGELTHTLWAAEHLGGDFKSRVEPLFDLMARRLDAVKDANVPFEEVDDDYPAQLAAEIRKQAEEAANE